MGATLRCDTGWCTERNVRSFAVIPSILTFLLLVNVVPPAAAGPTPHPKAPAAPRPWVDVSPQGTAKQVRQFTARFREPMVPFGDPRALSDPFEITCGEKGHGRWLEPQTWVYDFERDIPAGVSCSFRSRPDLKSLKGTAVAARTYTFDTGGPEIQFASPSSGDEAIEEEQAFILALDAEPDPASLLEHVRLEVQGLPQPLGIRLIEGADRDLILSTLWRGRRSGPIVVVQGTQRLPNDAKVSLVFGKGVRTRSGIANRSDQRQTYKTRKVFTANVRCERTRARAACIPLAPIRVSFSAPTPWSLAQQVSLVAPDGSRRAPRAPADDSETVQAVEFSPPFTESAPLRVELPATLADDAGRPLANADKFPETVRTDAYPPLAKFATRFGILEAADATLPVTVRNLETELRGLLLPPASEVAVTGTVAAIPAVAADQAWSWLRRVARARRDKSMFAGTKPPARPRTLELPKPNGAKAFEVVGIPLGQPGLYIVELASPALGRALLDKPAPLYVPAAALVTNLGVHLKWGRESSLVWVTTLDTAQPVAGAEVQVQDCQGKMLWQGRTDAAGVARPSALPARDALPSCYETESGDDNAGFDYAEYYANPALTSLSSGMMVTARHGNDMAFVHSSWNEGIQPWRYNLPNAFLGGPLVAHTILDRSLLRAGETVHMKHLLRKQGMAGLLAVPEAERPRIASIRHLGSDQHYDLPLQWNADDSAESTWEIPREAKLGRYEVTLLRGADDDYWSRLRSAEFRVQEFRVPMMRAVIQPPPAAQVAVRDVPLDLSASYLSGGAARQLPIVVRAQLRPRDLVLADDYEGYQFANGAVAVGLRQRGGDEDEEESAAPAVHQRDELHLDDAGAARAVIRDLPPADTTRDLLVELEYRDPNGEVQTVASTVPLWPAQVVPGVRAEFWASTDRISARTVVLDTHRRPVAGIPVVVRALQRRFFTHRKRLVGGFYGYDHTEEVRDLGEVCRGDTAANGVFECLPPPPAKGQLILQATLTDAAGHTSTAHHEVYVQGDEDLSFPVEDSDRIDVIPERRAYEPGETARFQVRMPFRSATALVTIEREGVAEAFVTTVSGSDPILEVPVLPQHAPNVFVSVLVVRGRSGELQPTALVDLGRPAFKLGIAEIRVGWKERALKVVVQPERDTYEVRDTARVELHVTAADGSAAAGAEVALAAVDEGLLELAPNRSWDLLEAMMGRRSYGVTTATAQMQVIGKRHYGLKALPHGGGGGRQGTRELFDTLLLWKGRVALDAGGRATVDVPLNDSITAFRIVAVAHQGLDRFGTGAATIRSTQDLVLISGLPSWARHGDRLRAECTVRNTTERAMQVEVRGRADGLAGELAAQAVALAPGAAQVVGWDVVVPSTATELRFEIDAAEQGSGAAADRLRVAPRVLPAVPVRPLQASIYRWGEDSAAAALSIAPPGDALPGQGGIRIDAAPRLADNLAAVETWMRDYPYTCLEQRVSRAVALRDPVLWAPLAAALPSYLDEDGLLKYFPRMGAGSDVLTAYVLSITQEAGLTLPDDTRAQMERGLRSFVDGSIRRSTGIAAADLTLRKLAAIAALARAGKAEPALLGSLAIEPRAWPSSALLDWWEILQRLDKVPRRAERLREVETIQRARLTLHGTVMGFAPEHADALWWLMVDTDGNAARLLLHLVRHGLWRDDVARVVRGLLARQVRGRWTSTVANAWAQVALDAFSKAYESETVSGTLQATLGAAQASADWAQPPQPVSLQLPWPPTAQTLGVAHQGGGRPWITVQSTAAIPLREPLWSGYQIRKTVTPVEQRVAGELHRGDLLRIRVEIEATSDMTWVVLDDPLAAAFSQVGTGSQRDSQIAQQGESMEAWSAPTFEERAQDAYRAYYEYLPKGTTAIEYTLRVNRTGTFAVPPTRVEAMYAPEIFGELPNPAVEVVP